MQLPSPVAPANSLVRSGSCLQQLLFGYYIARINETVTYYNMPISMHFMERVLQLYVSASIIDYVRRQSE